MVAFGVAAEGRREVLGFDVGDSENERLWTAFLRSLETRGLDGVKLVVSDAHSGLKKAISTVFQGAAWQRCRVHLMRNVLSTVPTGSQDMVASTTPANCKGRAASQPSRLRLTSTGCSAQ